jgi:hypothetical protein
MRWSIPEGIFHSRLGPLLNVLKATSLRGHPRLLNEPLAGAPRKCLFSRLYELVLGHVTKSIALTWVPHRRRMEHTTVMPEP